MSRLWTLSLMIVFCLCSHAQERFSQTFGGEADEHATAVVQAQDGNYVLAGFTYSFGKGKSDIWVMKVDRFGEEIWRKYFGGEDFDWANDLIETRDGNYVVAGYTKDPMSGKNNAWVFQLDRYGDQMWSHVYGGEKADEARSITQTRDGGYAVAGFSHSYGQGNSDIWLLRLNAVGEERWQKTFGGSGVEKAFSIIETSDDGLLLGGYQQYNNTNRADMLLVKTDRNGKGQWRRIIRSPGNNVVEQVREAAGGGYYATGWAYSPENRSLNGKLLKLTATGKVAWEKDFGEDGKDAFYSMTIGLDGGLMLVGQKSDRRNPSNLWLVNTDADGNQRWEKEIPGEKNDYAHAVALARDGGFVVAGGTKSISVGGSDMWLVKTAPNGGMSASAFAGTGSSRPNDARSRNEDQFSQLQKPNLYVLSVGVSDFEDESTDLTYAHTDAAAFSNRFAKQAGKLFNKVRVKQFLNEKATLINIKRGISWLEREATQKDMILIFISTHGALDSKGNLYILPNDFHPHNLFATALNIRDLTEGMNGTPCKKLILLDACHSGQSAYDLLEFASIKGANLNSAVAELVSKESGVTVMTSSSGKEFSYENPRWGHGAFTKAMLEGLDGKADFNHDRIISLLELNLYITERVKELTQGRQHPYTPINLFGNIPLYSMD
ncbi:MAG: caspase family protein [Bacteroidota bacterium]